MQWQLRMYRAKTGELDEFVAEWREHVLPLRKALGFDILGPWVTEDNRFVLIVGHADLAGADDAYYTSRERASIDPNPARHLVDSKHVPLEAR
jgi:NIPSNAP